VSYDRTLLVLSVLRFPVCRLSSDLMALPRPISHYIFSVLPVLHYTVLLIYMQLHPLPQNVWVQNADQCGLEAIQ